MAFQGMSVNEAIRFLRSRPIADLCIALTFDMPGWTAGSGVADHHDELKEHFLSYYM